MHQRVLLDTNLWSYIGQRGEASDFDKLEESRGIEVVLAPSVLLEICADRNVERRRAGVDAMTSRPRTTLKSEAQSFVEEIVQAARELRPEWLRAWPKTEVVNRHERYWRHRVWVEANRDPGAVGEANARLDQGELDSLLDLQRFNKAQLRESRVAVPPPHLARASFTSETPKALTQGWLGDDLETWRLETLLLYRHQLLDRSVRTDRNPSGSTLAEWADAWLKLTQVRREIESFNVFWLYEVAAAQVPRAWLAWGIGLAQLEAKAQRSNGLDVQHSAYLLDADVFLSADRRFVTALAWLHEHRSTDFAEPRWVAAEGSVVEAIADALG